MVRVAIPNHFERLAVIFVVRFDLSFGAALKLARRLLYLPRTDGVSETLARDVFFWMELAIILEPRTLLLFSFWPLRPDFFVGSQAARMCDAMGMDVIFRALLTLAQMPIGHRRVFIELAEWLSLPAPKTGLH